uniref:Uncharacterized protein n=1 Tax=Entomoneis paludosa TaxID=265537 RepID=A0A7S3DYD2_9STRA
MNYVDDSRNDDDIAPLSTASLLATTGTSRPQQAMVVSTPSELEPKPWDLPAHHYGHRSSFATVKTQSSHQELFDTELHMGRLSMCLGIAMLGTELVTGQGLPELLISSLSS